MMKTWAGLLICVGMLACATPTKPPLTEDQRLEQKYAGYSTQLLKSRRTELATYIAHGNPKEEPDLPTHTAPPNDPRHELEEIEAELIRRRTAGDKDAELSPAP